MICPELPPSAPGAPLCPKEEVPPPVRGAHLRGTSGAAPGSGSAPGHLSNASGLEAACPPEETRPEGERLTPAEARAERIARIRARCFGARASRKGRNDERKTADRT
jgi:hypothetical protein